MCPLERRVVAVSTIKLGPWFLGFLSWILGSLCWILGSLSGVLGSLDPWILVLDSWILVLDSWILGSLEPCLGSLDAWMLGSLTCHWARIVSIWGIDYKSNRPKMPQTAENNTNVAAQKLPKRMTIMKM